MSSCLWSIAAITLASGVPAEVLWQTPLAEISWYFERSFRDSLQALPIGGGSFCVDDELRAIAVDAASGITSAWRNGRRYKDFLLHGPPPGLPSFPLYSIAQKSKVFDVPLQRSFFHEEWARDQAKVFTRRQNVRSAPCVPPRPLALI